MGCARTCVLCICVCCVVWGCGVGVWFMVGGGSGTGRGESKEREERDNNLKQEHALVITFLAKFFYNHVCISSECVIDNKERVVFGFVSCYSRLMSLLNRRVYENLRTVAQSRAELGGGKSNRN